MDGIDSLPFSSLPLQLGGNVAPRPVQAADILLSQGDLALTLMGQKTMHYVENSPNPQTRKLAYLTQGSLRIPVIITSVRTVGNDALSHEEALRAGRYLPPESRECISIHPSDFGFDPFRRQNGRHTSYQQITFRLATPADRFRFAEHTQAQQQLLRVWGKYYREAAEGLADTIQTDALPWSPLTAAHLEVYRHNGILPRPHNHPANASMVDAVRFMGEVPKIRSIKNLRDAIYSPAQAFASHLKHTAPLTVKDVTEGRKNELDAGIGMAQYLVDYPRIETSLGTGVLAQMGMVSRVATIRPMMANRHHDPEKNPRLLVTLQAKQRHTERHHWADLSFELPIIVPAGAPVHEFRANELTDDTAKEHGYLSVKAMRLALGINKNSNPVIYSYPIERTVSTDLPETPDRVGTYMVRRQNDVWNAWQAVHDSSITAARDFFFRTVKPEEQTAALEHIQPFRERRLGETIGNGERLLPAVVRAANADRAARGIQPQPRRIREPRPRPTSGKLPRGEGWVMNGDTLGASNPRPLAALLATHPLADKKDWQTAFTDKQPTTEPVKGR